MRVATSDDVRRIALALPETAEQDHRGLPSRAYLERAQ